MIRLPYAAHDLGLLLAQGVAALAFLLLCAPSIRTAVRLYAAQGTAVAIDALWHAWGGVQALATVLAVLALAAALLGIPALLVRRLRPAATGTADRSWRATLPRFTLGVAVIGAVVLLMPALPGGTGGPSREHLVLIVIAVALGLSSMAMGHPGLAQGVGMLAVGNALSLAVLDMAGTTLLMLCCAAALAVSGAMAMRAARPPGGSA